MGLIEIEGMKFYAYHGHFEAEKVVGNQFEVNVRIKTNCSEAAQTDNLKHALNYQEVYLLIQKEMNIVSNLLENVAGRILDSLYNNFSGIENAQVKISKLNPPMGGEIKQVSVTLEK